MTLPDETRVDVRRMYKRPYLIHTTTGDGVTCQNNAWMDSVGVVMLIELVIGPARQGRKKVL